MVYVVLHQKCTTRIDRNPPSRKMAGYAGIAQLVEHDLAKVGVASSSLVSRSSLLTMTPQFAALSF